jgi:topoisomerase IV subunit A
LTGHLSIAADANIKFMLSGENIDLLLIGSDSGYGFVAKFSDLLTNYKNGKAVVTLKDGQQLLNPQKVFDLQQDHIAAITSQGRLLIFTLNQLPNLQKGKGNKIISISKKNMQAKNPEKLKFLKILPLNSNLVIYSGKHFFKMTPGNQKDYISMRGRRGKKLPRGFQNVHRIEIIPNIT